MSKYKKSCQPSFPQQEAKRAKKEAAELGHKPGKWNWKNGFWYCRCQNKGCTAEITINQNGHFRLNSHKRQCPIGVHSV